MCVDHSQLGASLDVYHLTTNALTRYRHTFTFRVGLGVGGGGVGDVAAVTLLPEKYAMPECVIVEIGMQTHLNCIKNNNESEE